MKPLIIAIALLLSACAKKGSENGSNATGTVPNPTPTVEKYCYEDQSCMSVCYATYPFKTRNEVLADCNRHGWLVTDPACVSELSANTTMTNRYDSCVARKI